MDPANTAAVDKCARSLFRLGKHEYALDYIKKAVAQAESPEPMLVMAHMLKQMNLFAYAREIMRMGTKSFPDDKRFLEIPK